MELSPVTQTQTVPAPVTGSGTQISSDFEVFLKMLTAQMRYQDPLNPVDSTDYATQLATFSGVEQAVLTNDLLKALTAQISLGGLSDMAGLVGKEVRSTAPASFAGQPLTLYPQAMPQGDLAELVVRDDIGREVQRMALTTGTDSITWAGVDPFGAPLPYGTYSFTVETRSNGTLIADTGVDTYARVTEVRLVDGQAMLYLAGGGSLPADQATAFRATGS